MSKKATRACDVKTFTDIPNIGPAIAGDFAQLGISTHAALCKKDAFTLYKKLCQVTGVRHDPCVLDTFLAAIDFMNGAPVRPWWSYTKERKHNYPNI